MAADSYDGCRWNGLRVCVRETGDSAPERSQRGMVNWGVRHMVDGVVGTGAVAAACWSKLPEEALGVRLGTVCATDCVSVSMPGVVARAVANARRLSSSVEAEAAKGLLICICVLSRDRNGCGRSTWDWLRTTEPESWRLLLARNVGEEGEKSAGRRIDKNSSSASEGRLSLIAFRGIVN